MTWYIQFMHTYDSFEDACRAFADYREEDGLHALKRCGHAGVIVGLTEQRPTLMAVEFDMVGWRLNVTRG